MVAYCRFAFGQPLSNQVAWAEIRRKGLADNEKKPTAENGDGLSVQQSRGDKTAIELFLSGIRALALQSSITDAVCIASRFLSVPGGE